MKIKAFWVVVSTVLLLCTVACNRTESENTPITGNPVPTPTIETLDIQSELVQNLYSYIDVQSIARHRGGEENIYQSTKTTIDSLTNTYKLLSVFHQMEPQSYPDRERECLVAHFQVEEVDEKLREMYGERASVVPEELRYFGREHPHNVHVVMYKEGVYEILIAGPSDNEPQLFSWNQLVKAEREDDCIFLYTNYAFFVYSPGEGPNPDKILFQAYGSSNREAIFAAGETDYFWPPNDFDYTLAPTYKSTFVKASNGSHYWVSTELVE
ncbi:MAG: hypothetical protein FWF88_02455 [Peptococcaceae bacterium]|nr:hypothetical protein [Peptococcaceae bacterium]